MYQLSNIIEPAERFAGEDLYSDDQQQERCTNCGTCEEFVQCPFQGYEELGWCSHYDEFTFKETIYDCWEGDE